MEHFVFLIVKKTYYINVYNLKVVNIYVNSFLLTFYNRLTTFYNRLQPFYNRLTTFYNHDWKALKC